MRKYRECLLSPVSAGVCCLIIFAFFQLFPFAKNTLSWCDMNQQVVPLLLEFKNILLGKADLFLNLANACGMSFWGILLFFVASPFSFLVLLIDAKDIYLFANILVLLKIMVCAGTASIFFRKKFVYLPVLQNIALSVMYAFCGYTMMYFQNVVWMDVMYMFPMLLLGMDRIINKEKVLLYIASLSCIITIHFYLSYMVAIFLILAMGLYTWFCVEKERRKKVICLFGVSTLIVLCITGVIWLPSLLQYLQSGRGIGLIDSLSSGSFFAELNTTIPVILCTGIILAITPLYFICKKYKHKKRNVIAVLLLLTLIPVFIEPINKMWHTGSYQAFPVRYGYITIFLGLILVADLLNNFYQHAKYKKDRIKKSIWMIITFSTAVAAIGALGGFFIWNNWDDLSTYTNTLHGSYAMLGILILFAVVTAIFYFFVMLLYRFHLIRPIIASIFICMMTVVEVMFFGSVYFGSASRTTDSNQLVLDLSDQISDNELYRVKMNQKYFDVNMIGALGYNSLSHYTSLTDETYMFAMKKLGYSSYWMEVNSNGGTRFIDSLLGNRYNVVLNTSVSNQQEVVYQNSKYSIVKNTLPTTFGFVFTTDNIADHTQLVNSSREDVQNQLFQSIYHTSDVLTKSYTYTSLENVVYTKSIEGLHVIDKQNTNESAYMLYTIPVQGTQTLYFDCFHALTNRLVEPMNNAFDIYVNGKLVQNRYPSQKNNGLLELGTFTDETVVIKVNIRKDVVVKSFGVFGIDLDLLTEYMDEQTTVNLRQEGNRILGTANATKMNSYLFLPISHTKGFKATVNGEETEIHTIFDTFMAIPLQQGSNTVTISYIPNGFISGGILSIVGIVLCAGFIFLLNKECYHYIHFIEWVTYVILFGLLVIVIITVYIAPVIIYIVF